MTREVVRSLLLSHKMTVESCGRIDPVAGVFTLHDGSIPQSTDEKRRQKKSSPPQMSLSLALSLTVDPLVLFNNES